MGNRVPIMQMLTFGLLPECLKIIIYRLEWNKICRNVKLSIGSIICSTENFSIGDGTKIVFFSSQSWISGLIFLKLTSLIYSS